ncbi:MULTISPECIES: hypothetical protein [Rhodococcus]|uniref:hypothetical protein n=1 Tax=Rhodococcus TaxID=1827 RepID=UPI00192C8A12|nr:hypothetical protein [Rhodococcus sp. 21391]QQZ16796.1 hypothetical protein GO592_12065 [Rhodococcus sp. 21391]
MATNDWGPWLDVPLDQLRPGTTLYSRFELRSDIVAAVRELVDGVPVPIPVAGEPVSPAVYSSFLPFYRALGGRIEQGTVHTHQSISVNSEPAKVGDVLDADVTVVSAELNGDKRPVVVDIVFRSGSRWVCTTRSRYLWGYSAPRAAAR